MSTRLVLIIQCCLNPSLTLDQFTPLTPWTRAALGCCVARPGALCNVPPDATAVPPSSCVAPSFPPPNPLHLRKYIVSSPCSGRK